MKKSNKAVAAIAAFTMAVSAFAFAGCGGGEDVKPTETPTEEPAKISYQFLGNYDELMSWGFVYDFRVDCTPDGTATVSIYNKADDITTIKGTWSQKEVDGENVITLRDGINPDGKYEIYSEASGNYVIKDYYFTFSGGYSRKIDLSGSSKITYDDDAAWTKAVEARRSKLDVAAPGGNQQNDQKTEAPTTAPTTAPTEATAVATFKKDSSTITFFNDGTGKVSVFGAMNRTFKWTKGPSITDVKTNEGKADGTITVTGTTITASLTGGETTYSVEFANCDLSALK